MGLRPQLIVKAPSGSQIDLLKNGIILNTYTLGTNETECSFIVDIGEYNVKIGTKEKYLTIDVIGQYFIEFKKDFYTSFSKKETDWVESGGNFSYGNGLYLPANTIDKNSSNIWHGYQLIIPVDFVDNFIIETAINIPTTSASEMAEVGLLFFDNSNTRVFAISRSDAWTGEFNQYGHFSALDKSYTIQQKSTSYNGIVSYYKLEYKNNLYNLYVDNKLIQSGSIISDGLSRVAITMCRYQSYPQGKMIIPYLKIVEV